MKCPSNAPADHKPVARETTALSHMGTELARG